MKKLVYYIVIATGLSLSACASLKLTVINDRRSDVKNVEVKAGAQRYILPGLAAGASDTHVLTADADGTLAVNFVSAEGGLYYTAAKTKLVKGQGRRMNLRLTEKGDLVTEEK